MKKKYKIKLHFMDEVFTVYAEDEDEAILSCVDWVEIDLDDDRTLTKEEILEAIADEKVKSYKEGI